MAEFKPLIAIGMMSGTSMDGVDAALLTTNGVSMLEADAALTVAYGTATRARLAAALGGQYPLAEVEREITLIHAKAVNALLAQAGRKASEIGVIGFHGHTILHDPAHQKTWQIGDGPLLARETGIAVVDDFRSADMAAGGEGAPFAPAYHAALAHGLERPLAVLNLGGVANVTWIGAEEGALLAFDTGPGNAPIDDWVLRHIQQPYDRGGALAARGKVDESVLNTMLGDPYFERPPPKSLDRSAFDMEPVEDLSAADGAATLTAFTAASVARARDHFPAQPQRWLACGGGRHNPVLMRMLKERLGRLDPVEDVGWNGDAIEAQAFAYLAVRSLRGLPLSFPGTTGVSAPVTGGRRHAVPG